MPMACKLFHMFSPFTLLLSCPKQEGTLGVGLCLRTAVSALWLLSFVSTSL